LALSAGQEASLELAALAINLSKNCRCCELMKESNKLSIIIRNGLRNQDPLIMKLLRNLAEQTPPQILYDSADTMAEILSKSNSSDFVNQCIEIAAFFKPEKLDLTAWLRKSQIFSWIKQFFNKFLTESDKKFEGNKFKLYRSRIFKTCYLISNFFPV